MAGRAVELQNELFPFGAQMKPSILVLTALLALPFVTRAEDKKPTDAKDPIATMEVRASEAFNRGQYSLAKELFTKIADKVKDDKTRLGAIQEQIRVCDTNIKQLASSTLIPADQANQPQTETAAEKRKKHVPPKEGEVLAVAIKDLGNFEYDGDKGGNIPDDVKKLNGSKIRVSGFMIPLDQADNISHFSLVPSLFACCFGQPPQIQHQIVVHTPKGKAVGYYPDEIVCEGTLKVDEKKDDGYIVSVFEMDVQSVKPAAK
jgi:hypothetical protein